ncbi:MAG: class I SAM-dependent methyltransferase [Thermoproteota archaeon]|nr:class I SAM-dependent methyltransferase [Thermoproteota archaeon]
MSDVWDKAYKSDNAFFGDEPSGFALICIKDMKGNNVKRVLEIGAGHGRDSLFFASSGIEVYALDYSATGMELLGKKAHVKGFKIKTQVFDARNPLPFPDAYFDSVYSHMVFNMRFSKAELHSAFSEINRVLKPEGLYFFSVRNNHDKFYSKGVELESEDGVYNINGFELRFFSEKEIDELVSKCNFKKLWMREEDEDPVTLYTVATSKIKLR